MGDNKVVTRIWPFLISFVLLILYAGIEFFNRISTQSLRESQRLEVAIDDPLNVLTKSIILCLIVYTLLIISISIIYKTKSFNFTITLIITLAVTLSGIYNLGVLVMSIELKDELANSVYIIINETFSLILRLITLTVVLVLYLKQKHNKVKALGEI